MIFQRSPARMLAARAVVTEAGADPTGRTDSTPIERMVFRFLENEVVHRQKTEAQCRVRRFRDLVARQTRLEGEPYVFHRQDAYEGDLG